MKWNQTDYSGSCLYKIPELFAFIVDIVDPLDIFWLEGNTHPSWYGPRFKKIVRSKILCSRGHVGELIPKSVIVRYYTGIRGNK